MKERKADTRKSGILLLLLMFSFAVAGVRGYGDFAEPSEVIYVAVFFGGHYGDHLSKMVLLDFDDVGGLPVDTGLPCFGDGFVEGKYEIIAWGTQGYAARVRAHYDISVGNETAELYADQVRHEFLDVFNQTDLETFYRNRFIKGSTIEVWIDQGYFPQDNLTIMENLLAYKPTEGFADLITPDFLSIFVPGNFSCGCIALSYTMRKVADGFIWNFHFGYSVSKDLEDVKDVETVNLQRLLGTSRIEHFSERSSTIMIDLAARTIMKSGTYHMTFDSVTPAGNVTEEDARITFTYPVTEPVDNVVAEVRITKQSGNMKRYVLVAAAIILVAVFAALLSKRSLILKKSGSSRSDSSADHASAV